MLMGASEEEHDDSPKTIDTTDTMESFVTIAVNESISVAGRKGGDKYRQWYTFYSCVILNDYKTSV